MVLWGGHPACQSRGFRVGLVGQASRLPIDNSRRLCYPAPMMKPAIRNRLIIGAAALAAAVFLAYQMYYSQTPARHADHDHAIAKIAAGGFLWVEAPDGERRNLVGRPEKVLVLHWFDPTTADFSEETAAAEFAASVSDDAMVEILFVADAPSWEGIDVWAEAAGVPKDRIYLDQKGKTTTRPAFSPTRQEAQWTGRAPASARRSNAPRVALRRFIRREFGVRNSNFPSAPNVVRFSAIEKPSVSLVIVVAGPEGPAYRFLGTLCRRVLQGPPPQ